MKRRRRRKAALPVDPIQQVLGELIGEVRQNLIQGLLGQQITQGPPMFQPEPQRPDIKDAEVISIRDNP